MERDVLESRLTVLAPHPRHQDAGRGRAKRHGDPEPCETQEERRRLGPECEGAGPVDHLEPSRSNPADWLRTARAGRGPVDRKRSPRRRR